MFKKQRRTARARYALGDLCNLEHRIYLGRDALEFARSFQAVPGQARYEVVVVHPCTGRPVKVCFSLPGCPRRVKCGKNSVVFRYGLCKTVVLSFERDGQVRVR